MTTTAYPIEQLRHVAAEFRHMRNEHKREGEHGRTRREIGVRLDGYEQRFQTLLHHWVSDESEREAWLEHFYRGASAPDDDLDPVPPVFLGRSEVGSEIRIAPSSDGTYDIVVDGTRVDRVSPKLSFPANTTTHILGQSWREFSLAPAPALEALRTHCAAPKGTPPWQWARELFADGLIDVNFSLTPRGCRVINLAIK